MFNPGNVLGVA